MGSKEDLLRAEEIAARILSFKPAARTKKAWLNDDLGVPYRTFRDWEEGRFYPSDSHLRRIAQKLNAPREWLEYGQAFPPLSILAHELELRRWEQIAKEEYEAALKQEMVKPESQGDLSRVEEIKRSGELIAAKQEDQKAAGKAVPTDDPELLEVVQKFRDLRASLTNFYTRNRTQARLDWMMSEELKLMGSPFKKEYDFVSISEAHDFSSEGPVFALLEDWESKEYHFRRDWLSRVTSSRKECFLWTVRGNAMFPTIQDGDMVLVDGSKTEIEKGHIYVVHLPDEKAVVRRVETIKSDKVRVVSENRKGSPTKEYHENDVRILGEVIWLARTLAGGMND